MRDFRSEVLKDTSAFIPHSSEPLSLTEVSHHGLRMLKQPMEGPMWKGLTFPVMS